MGGRRQVVREALMGLEHDLAQDHKGVRQPLRSPGPIICA